MRSTECPSSFDNEPDPIRPMEGPDLCPTACDHRRGALLTEFVADCSDDERYSSELATRKQVFGFVQDDAPVHVRPKLRVDWMIQRKLQHTFFIIYIAVSSFHNTVIFIV